jgi:hypothetical protein
MKALSSGMLCHVIRWKFTKVSEERNVSSFRVEDMVIKLHAQLALLLFDHGYGSSIYDLRFSHRWL